MSDIPVWQDFPYHPILNAARLTGRSPAHVYALLKAGDLKAVTLGGKTLITTESIVAYLGRAKPWRANSWRVAAANKKRAEIAGR